MGNIVRHRARSFAAFTYLTPNCRRISRHSPDHFILQQSAGPLKAIARLDNTCVTAKSIASNFSCGVSARIYDIDRLSTPIFQPLSLRRSISRRPLFTRFSPGGFSRDPEDLGAPSRKTLTNLKIKRSLVSASTFAIDRRKDRETERGRDGGKEEREKEPAKSRGTIQRSERESPRTRRE